MFSPIEKEIFAKILSEAEDAMSNNGCNDFEVKVTRKNKADLLVFINEMCPNSDEEERLVEQVETGTVYFVDWLLLAYLKHKILNTK
jgi:hypothetical protein